MGAIASTKAARESDDENRPESATPHRHVAVPKPPDASAIDGIGLLVPIFSPFHYPPAHIQPITGPGKHQPQSIPTRGGA